MGITSTRQSLEALPSLWWAGLITVSLVWYAGASSLPGGLSAVDDHLLLHASAGGFFLLSLLLNTRLATAWKLLSVLGQATCAAAFIAVDGSSSGPILNIVLVAQLPWVLGFRRTVMAAVLINIVQVCLLMVFHQASPLSAILSTALFACFQLFSLLIAHYAVQVSEARNALAATNAELLATRSLLESSARDRERLRVSRELHDTAGHMLTALKLNLRQLRDRSAGADRAALGECLQLSSDLLEDIRALVGNLRDNDPPELERALAELTRPFVQPVFHISVAPGAAIRDMAVAKNLLAVARETITNVVRHAQASHCWISVSQEGGQLRLTVADDGIGVAGPEGFGIRGMRERMENPDDGLEITPNAPRGTRVSAVWANA